MAAFFAFGRPHVPELIDSFGRCEWTAGAGVAGLAAGFSFAFLFAAAFAGLARHSIGGRGFGGCGGILSAQRQLSFQIGDLLFAVGDLLLFPHDLLIFLKELLGLLAELLLQSLHLAVQALVFAPQGLLIPLWMGLRARSSALRSHGLEHLVCQMFGHLSTHLNCYGE